MRYLYIYIYIYIYDIYTVVYIRTDEASAVAGPRACKQHAHNLSTSSQSRVEATYYTEHEARQAADTHWRFLVRQMRRDRRPMRNTTPQ